ncbi:MAG TPA: ribonuclease HI [Clostridia bacterium]|nr:ribonuclease HI [Clostridia bacterium]
MTNDVTREEIPCVEIYTDGGCDPNPGAGGYGAVLLHPKKRAEISGGFRRTTNNRMEIYAAIKGLELLKKPCKVTLYSDSQYLVNAMMKGWARAWKRKNWWRTNQERALNADLWKRLLELCEIHKVKFVWVRGHAGNKENERCDSLSCVALRKPNLPVDEGYEKAPEPTGERPKLTEAGQPCWKCGTPVTKQKSQKKPSGDYYFEYYLYCPKCQATYQVDAAKRQIERPPSLF